MTCQTCRHSEGIDEREAKKLRRQGWATGYGEANLKCEKHKTVGPLPAYRCGWERTPGADDELATRP